MSAVGEMRRRVGADPLAQKTLINMAILLALCTALAITAPNFLDTGNFANVLRQISVVGIVAAASTLVMVAGGLDLSVGGVAALAGVVAALTAQGGLPLPLAFSIGVAVGAVAGAVNALLVVQFGLNSVIATLGTLYVCRGTANLLSDGLPVRDVPDAYGELGTGSIGWLPTPTAILIVVVVALTVLERRTLLGKFAVAVGSNLEAARLSGIKVARVRIVLHVSTGAAAGLGGILISSRLNSGQPTSAQGLEFDVIVAAVLGGTSLAGGEGRVIGSLIGALIIGVVNNGLNLLRIESFWQTIVQGVILVGAVGIDVAIRRRSGRRIAILGRPISDGRRDDLASGPVSVDAELDTLDKLAGRNGVDRLDGRR